MTCKSRSETKKRKRAALLQLKEGQPRSEAARQLQNIKERNQRANAKFEMERNGTVHTVKNVKLGNRISKN